MESTKHGNMETTELFKKWLKQRRKPLFQHAALNIITLTIDKNYEFCLNTDTGYRFEDLSTVLIKNMAAIFFVV